jgi:hypothetical protein
MRDLRIHCNSGDADTLLFTTSTRGIDVPTYVVVRDKRGESTLWLRREQVKRLAEWLQQSLNDKPEEPEEI